MADFYFTDRKYNQLGIASTDELASSSVIAIDDIGGQEGDYQSVDGGYRSYSATLHFSPDQSAQVEEMAKVGNFVLFKGRAGESVWTTILSSEHDPLTGTNRFVAEDASIDLINGTVGAYAASSAMTIAQYIELFAGDSGFVIGYNEIPDLTRTLNWDSDDSSILTRILSVATQFGVELSFRFEVRGLSVIGKYIDIRKHIGGNKGIYLRVDTDLNKIVTTSDIADLCTAIAGTGGTPDGSDTPITLKDYHWIDPNGRYVLGDDGVLRDPVALRTWSRLLSNSNPDPKDAHITRTKTYEATTQATLLQSVLSDLEKFNHPAVNYEVDIAKLPDTVNIGDTVYLVDEDEQLYLSARVLELTYSYSNESGTATLGDYLIEAGGVDPAYRALAETLAKQNKGKDGVGLKSSIVTYQAGTSGVTAPTGTWSEMIPAVSPGQFLWSRTVLTMTDGSSSTTYSVGKIGDNGAPGNGIQSSTVTYQVGTSGTTAPTGTWSSSVPAASQGTYLWSRVVNVYTDGTQNTSYSVAYQAKDGAQGAPGSQDVPMTYVQAETPTGEIVANSLWWVGTTMSSVTALKRWDGSSWIPETIAQAVLNVVSLNAVTITGSTITGSKFISSFSGVKPDGTADFSVHGTTTIADGSIVTDTYSDTDDTQITHVVMDQFGFLSNIYNKGTLMASTQMSLGMLTLGSNYQETASDPLKWVTSSLDALKIYQLNNVSNSLWEGVSLMGWSGNAQSVTPSKKITDCLNGWKLVWGEYKNGAFTGTGISESEISKTSVLKYPGAGRILSIMNYGNANCSKYVYAYADHIDGNTKNSDGAAGGVVLVGIYEY